MAKTKFDTKMLEALIPAVMNAVIVALEAMDPGEVEEIKLESYVPTGSVKEYKKFDDFPDSLSIKQASEMLGVPYQKVYELSRSKNTPFVVWGKSKRMVNKHDLIKYLEERRGGYILDQYNEDEDE